MLNNVLAMTLENLGKGGFVFFLGLGIVFLGIVIIVIVVSVIGAIMKKTTSIKNKRASLKNQQVAEVAPLAEAPVVAEVSSDIPDHVKAAIVAAITAYYFNEQSTSNCEFIIRKIKKI